MGTEVKVYLEYALKETINFQVYLSAAVIGTVICFFTSNYSVVPFITPLLVQILVRSNVKFRNRHQEALVELPSQKADPVFIMDLQGNIVLSIGKTLDIFKKYAIMNIKDFLNEEVFDNIIDLAFSRDPLHLANHSVEAFSNRSLKWYEIKAKATGIQYGGKEQKILVWFQDISLRKIYHLRLLDLLRYSDSLIDSLERPMAQGTESGHLAYFLLKEYDAVFITRANQENNLEGYVFKNNTHKMIKSDAITVNKESLAPINISRQSTKVISDDILSYNSKEEFLQKNPFDSSVLDFIDIPVRNFITHNEADISIIAFNFRSKITTYERQFFEIVINIYKTMVISVDLKKELQKKVTAAPKS